MKQKDIALAIIQGNIIADQMKGETPTVQRLPDTTEFPRPLQRATVPANGSINVWKFTVPPGYIGYPSLMANTRKQGTRIYMIKDGKRLNEDAIRNAMADINSPIQISPWWKYEFYDSFEWRYHNDSSKDQHHGVLFDGFYIPVKDKPLLIKHMKG